MINNSLFKLEKIPSFHPVLNKFERILFWRDEKRKCMEGHWIGGLWCPGELYYYVNFHNINVEKGTYKGLGLPFFRDIDWEMFRVYTEAIGFSGFQDDTEESCHRAILDIESNTETKEDVISRYCIYPDTGKTIEKVYNNIFKKNGSVKRYVPAREYLARIHKKSFGKPCYYNESKHLLLLGSRGFGKSFGSSGMIAANFLFDGSHDYDEYIELKRAKTYMKSETNVGAIDAKYSGDLLRKVKIAFDNLPDSHIITDGNDKRKVNSPLMPLTEGSFAAGKAFTSSKTTSLINHRTLQDNPLVFNGTRPNRVFLDEVGFISNILEAWEALEASQAAESFKRMSIIGMGTGGLTSGGAAMHTHEIFYNPEQYGCLMFNDDWENRGNIGYFVPATVALNKFKEGPNLITNHDRALRSIEAERDAAKKSPTRTKLMGTIINKPLYPSEIFLRMEGTFFPIQDLKVRLSELESVDSILGATYKYDFNIKDGKVVPSISTKPVIREFPLRKGLTMDGCVEVFELPKEDANGNVFSGRYAAGWDPVVNDGNENTEQSLQSLIIMDLWTSRIVAEYTARTYLAEEYYETARRLLIYFNAQCNYESNIKGPYAYFKNKNSLHLLVETPDILKDQNFIKGSTIGNKSLGTNTNDSIIVWSLGLTLSWMEAQAYGREEGVRNLQTILSPGILKEAISFSRDINTDRISALGMLMIIREDRTRITEIAKTNSVKTKSSDTFWNKAYKRSDNYNILNTMKF